MDRFDYGCQFYDGVFEGDFFSGFSASDHWKSDVSFSGDFRRACNGKNSVTVDWYQNRTHEFETRLSDTNVEEASIGELIVEEGTWAKKTIYKREN